MPRKMLRNDQWERIEHLLPGKSSDCGVTAKDNRLFVEAVCGCCAPAVRGVICPRTWAIGIPRTRGSRGGARKACGKASAKPSAPMPICKLFCSTALLFALINMPLVCKKKGSQALGRSRAGLSTKIHMTADALGNPVRWQFTAGQAHDITQAPALIAGFQVEQVIADKAYDSNAFIELIRAAGAEVVIRPLNTRREPHAYDRHAYRERHLNYNFGRIHKTLRATPAMEARVSDHVWSLEEIAALAN